MAEQSRTYNSLTGNLGALYRATEVVALVVNVGRGFRAPSTFDLFSFGVHEGTLQFDIGDPTLGNETSLNADLALRIQSGTVAGEIAGFVNAVDGFIYPRPTGVFDDDPADPEASGNQEYRISQGDARFVGFEASLDWHPVSWVELHGGADYVRAAESDAGSAVAVDPAVPRYLRRALPARRVRPGGSRIPFRRWRIERAAGAPGP